NGLSKHAALVFVLWWVSAMRLDILSAILTVFSMTEIGQKKWQGWALEFSNSVVVCILAVHVAPKQWALIPPNVLCLFIYARNLWSWKHAEDPQYKNAGPTGELRPLRRLS